MKRFFAALLRAFKPARTPPSVEEERASRRERLRALAEERARLVEMVPYLRDFHFEDIARDYEDRISRIDAEMRVLERAA